MNHFVTFRAYYQGLSFASPHQYYPITVALQVFEFLYLVNFKISAVLSAQFTGMPLHSLFQGVGLHVLREIWQLINIVEKRSLLFPLITIPVECRGFCS